MKLSSAAVLLSAAVAALPGASAATVSLRGILPENEILADFANCDTKTNCPTYGINSCQTIDKNCNGQCFWAGNSCKFSNRGGGGGNRFACRDFTRRTDCLDEDCDWLGNGVCHAPSGPSNRNCRDFTRRTDCLDEDCDWLGNGVCRAPSGPSNRNCRDFTRRSDCLDEDCDWLGGVCRVPSVPSNRNDCREITRRSDCLDFDCEWVGPSNSNGECRIPALSFRCSDFDNSSRNQCEREGCSWNSSTRNCFLLCRDFDGSNRGTCERSGYCDWDNGSCDIRSCRDLDDTSRNECQDNDVCTWNSSNRSCRFSSSSGNRSCNRITTQNQCLNNNCDWRSGQCRIPSPSPRCSAYNGNKSQCKNNGCSWNSNSRICSTFRFNNSEEEQKEE